MLVVVGGRVVGVDERSSIVENGADEHPEGEHIAERRAGGGGLHLRGGEVEIRLTHLGQLRGERLARHWTLRQVMWE